MPPTRAGPPTEGPSPLRSSDLLGLVQKQLGAAGDVGFKQAMQQKWVAIDKSGGEVRTLPGTAIFQHCCCVLQHVRHDR